MRRRILIGTETDPYKPTVDAFIERVKTNNGSFLYGTEKQTRLKIKEHIKLLGSIPKLDWLAYTTDSNGNVTKVYSIDELYDSININGVIQVVNNKFVSSAGAKIYMNYADTKFTLYHIVYDGNLKQYTTSESVFVCGVMVSPYTTKAHMFFQNNKLNIQYNSNSNDGYSTPYVSGQVIDITFGKVNYIENLKLNGTDVIPTEGMVDFWGKNMDVSYIKIYDDFNHVLGC